MALIATGGGAGAAMANTGTVPDEPVLPYGPNVSREGPTPDVLGTATVAPRSTRSEVTAAVSFHDGSELDLIPLSALAAYQRTEVVMADAMPTCRLDWTVLAAVGQVLTDHGRQGGDTAIDDEGRVDPAIVGAAIRDTRGRRLADTDAGSLDGNRRHDQAVGPMLLAPAAWRDIGVDGDADGARDPQDIDDAALAAAVLLCVEGDNLRRPRQLARALKRMNDAEEFVTAVPEVAAAYEAGTVTGDPFPVFPGPAVALIGAVATASTDRTDGGATDDEPARGKQGTGERDETEPAEGQDKGNDKGKTTGTSKVTGTGPGKPGDKGLDKGSPKDEDTEPVPQPEEPTTEPTEPAADPDPEPAPEPAPEPDPEPEPATAPTEEAATAPEEAPEPADTGEVCDSATVEVDGTTDSECTSETTETVNAESTEPTDA